MNRRGLDWVKRYLFQKKIIGVVCGSDVSVCYENNLNEQGVSGNGFGARGIVYTAIGSWREREGG